MSSPEYQNLITLFLIRSLSSLTPYYPQFHISSPSILKTSKLWAQKNQKIDALTRLSISYCRSVGAPDNELLASLDKLNPYPLASVLVMRCSPGPERDNSFGLSIWSSFLSWAKSLEPKPPEQLVEKLETLLTECCLCFPPNLSRTSVIQTTFEFEKSLASVADTVPIDYDIQDTILQTLYSVPPSSWSQWRRVIPVVLIPRAGESAVFPGSWVTIHVTKANGEAFSQVCGHIKGRWMPTLQFWKDYMQKYSSFEEAIKNINTFHAITSMTDPGSTRETVIQRQLIEGEDLAPVQSMIKYRAQLFDSFKDISEPQIYFDSNWELDIYNTPSREDCPVM
ncbi:hypothetical protein VNI00_010178 [Paramarasmius palmivorus]|uniref:Uncharacterized protein n=1 Tax=Paramarasmius palmivorus TaxID=297713 RepID=A0AAW0CHE3_9AGAR